MDCGYPTTTASFSENLGLTTEGVDDMLAAWKASPAHDPNLRNPAYVAIGIARASAGAFGNVWATEFGSDPR
jgi:uncharacterized protein YkwD